MPKTTKPVRWTRTHAAAEFNLDAATLSKRLLAASIAPGEDGRFSTKQIVGAVFGDRAGALTAKAKAEAENWQLMYGNPPHHPSLATPRPIKAGHFRGTARHR